MPRAKTGFNWTEIERRFQCNKFQFLSDELKEKFKVNEAVSLNDETKTIYKIFHKYGYDLSTPGDGNYYNITSQMADELLVCDTRNRKKYESNVNGIIGDILHDDFHLDKDAIAFSKDGNILSGAQRLTAIKQSGKSAVLFVLTVFIDPFVQMDTGQKRNFIDNQNIQGNKLDAKISTVVNAATRYIKTFDGFKIADRNDQKIKDMIYNEYKDAFTQWLDAGIVFRKKRWIMYATFCFILNGEDERLVCEFTDMATKPIPITYVPMNKFEAFMLSYNRLMASMPNEGIYLPKYIDLCKYAFDTFKKYYSKRDKCIKFGYEPIPNGTLFRRAGHISAEKKMDLQLDEYKQKWAIDLSFLAA